MENRIRSSTDPELQRIKECIFLHNIYKGDMELLLESLTLALKGEEAAIKTLGDISAILNRQYHTSAEDDIEQIRRVIR